MTMQQLQQQPDDGQLCAWLDGELPPEQRAQIDDWLRDHPEDAARVRLWAADRDALRARFDSVLAEPLPPALQRVVMPPAGRVWPWGVELGWARAAVMALLLVGGGLIGGGLVWQFKSAAPSAQATPNTWTHRAAVAHVVYAPEVRHPVEVNVVEGTPAEQRAQELHLARWLTKRINMPVRLYDLRPHGFELVGGRLLPDATGPSAQLMYQNSAGQRVTLYLRRPEAGAATSFRYQREGEVGMFYWIEDGYGCAMVGTLPRERLLALAESVYQQAEDAAKLSPPAAPVAPTSPTAPVAPTTAPAGTATPPISAKPSS